MIEEINDEVAKALAALPATASTDDLNDGLGEPYAAISTRAREYAFRVHEWWRNTQGDVSPPPDDPRSVILWFSTLNSSKVFRALHGLVEFDGDRE